MFIPGTTYQLQGKDIIGPGGNVLSQQEFLQKVESKEISLTSASLRFLAQELGPDMEKSLMTASGLTVPTQVLASNVISTEGVVGDIFSLMELFAKMSMDQKRQANERNAHEADMQINAMNKSADEALAAARVRMIAGVISGVANIASGAMGAIGSGKALSALKTPPTLTGADGVKTALSGEALKTWTDATMQAWSSVGKMTEGLAQASHASMELGAGGHDKNAKLLDAEARRWEHMQGESRDMAESLREMNAKVREVIRDMQAAENQAMGTIVRQ